MLDGRASDVHFVEHGLVERDARRSIRAPIECTVDDDRARRAARVRFALLGVVTAGEVVSEDAIGPTLGRVDRARIRIEQEHVRVEAKPALRLPWTVHAEAVALSRLAAWDEAVPREVRTCSKRSARLFAALVDEAELHARGVLGVDGEVDAADAAVLHELRAERKGVTGKDAHS